MICPYCTQEMTDKVPCTYAPEGRVPNEDRPCHDCGVPPHALHHPGCDVERCHHTYRWNREVLHAQAISCAQCAQEWCEREGHDYGEPNDDGHRDCIWCGEPEPAPHVWPPA